MDYVFGENIVKTVDKKHSDLEGLQEVERKYPGETILDHFVVTEKIKSSEDSEGKCYDWYRIKDHYRYSDTTPPLRQAYEMTKADTEQALIEEDTMLDQRMSDIEMALVELDKAQNGGM